MSDGDDSGAQQPAPSDDLTGKTVGRFIIRGKLGSGGMGEVYRAEDTKLKRSVAMKRVSPELAADAQYRRRILKEAERASRLSSPHIAQIFDVLEEPTGIYLVMEFIEGETLRARLRRPMSLPDFMKVAVECAEALVAAHDREIVHCDLKPENIMLTPTGGVKVLDFGVARDLSFPAKEAATQSLDTGPGAIRGTPAYMAPEVLLEHGVDARSDIFSLGVVFYEALAGAHPFRAASLMATSDRVLHESPRPLTEINPEVKAGISRVILKMLAKNSAERYSNAQALLEDFTAAAEAITHPSILPRHITAPSFKLPRRKTAYAVAAFIVIAAMFIAVIVWRKGPPAGNPSEGIPRQAQLAVLPFEAIGGSTETAAFGDGLIETLTARLTEMATNKPIQVVPAAEVRSGKVKTAEEARQQFGANLVLEGSLERSGDMVRITYSLVDPKTKRQVKAGTVTAAASNPFAVEDQVVDDVARMLSLGPSLAAANFATSRGTQIPGAYDLYLEGRGYLQNYDRPENIEKAIGAFQGALRIDPNDALAYAGLGSAYLQKYVNSSKPSWITSARDACEKAVNFDAKLATARTCLGLVDNATGQYEKATREFEQALSADPGSDDAYHGLANAQERLGKTAEAERTFRRAIEMHPQYWGGYNALGSFYFGQGRYAEAARAFSQVVAMSPDNFMAYYNLGGTYLAAGDTDRGIEALRRSIALRPTTGALGNLGTAYYYSGKFKEAAQAYEEAVKLEDSDFMIWGNLGDADYWVPERKERSREAYQRAIELGEAKLKVNPRSSSVLSSLGWFYARLGNQAKAFADVNRAVVMSPKDPILELNRALVDVQFGRTEEALASIEKALAGGLTPKMVRDDPSFGPLSSNPKFQKLVQGS